MDILFWIILIIVIAAVIWWLLNRNKSANAPGASGTRSDGALEGGSAAASADAAATTGIPTAAGFGRAAEPAAPATAEESADSSASPRATPPTAEALDTPGRDSSGAGDGTDFSGAGDERRLQDEAEWETQWSEAGPSGSRPAPATAGPAPATAAAPVAAAPAAGAAPGETDTAQPGSVEHGSPAPVHALHHDEYTAPHAPTLPGAETAAVEETAAAETIDRAESSALVEEAGAQYQELAPLQSEAAGEPTGHLAADEPYGAGSASPAADGSGPADYSVKADAAAMVYYEEGHPDYEQTRAEVWFESAAHAEAAGFRAPRRKRLQQEDGPL
ncbi:hypothetical protein [Arthrobacter sp. SLBN-112]|uniref:sunset domain-containing protein n=1 Tax=Arthrobacter sp. SLBN-112 TaxID=2768452 RepID=UPI0027ADDA91|nr:hypothetical protein [Arthrobacter sp. SLBN-112]MDQ0800787.1 hypothetical protein [Arthrobacter sp. SLBN-112]